MGKKKESRVRHIGFVWMNPADNYLEVIQKWYDINKGNYCVIGHEIAPTTGCFHIQGYMQLTNRVDYKVLLNSRPSKKIHIDKLNGTVEDNINYCKKDNDWMQMGEPRLSGHGTEKSLALWEDCIKHAKSGELYKIEQISPKYYTVYYNTWQKMSSDFAIVKGCPKLAIWIYGKTDVGKSRFCEENFPDAFWKQLDKWWDGYKGQKVVVIDDIDQQAISIRELKNIADRYPLVREVKGGTRPLCNDLLICSSNYSIGATFASAPDEHVKAIKRRFIEVEAIEYNELLKDLTVYFEDNFSSLHSVIKFYKEKLSIGKVDTTEEVETGELSESIGSTSHVVTDELK